jgi:transcriptional regulator with XRE-family HTH domain
MNFTNLAKKENRVYASPRNYTALGKYLQEMRLRAKLTQREVSIELGYSSAQFISNFESGIASPPLCKLPQLVGLYKIPVERLISLILEGEKETMLNVLRPDFRVKARNGRGQESRP